MKEKEENSYSKINKNIFILSLKLSCYTGKKDMFERYSLHSIEAKVTLHVYKQAKMAYMLLYDQEGLTHFVFLYSKLKYKITIKKTI